jgi:hypothetical protein
MKRVNHNFYFTLLDRLKKDTNLSKIQKEFNLSKQNLNYYLRKLQKDNIILNKGYGHWEVIDKVKIMPKGTLPKTKDSIRGHAFIWKVKLPNIPNWNDRINILNKNKIPFKLVGLLKTTPRIIINKRKVWLGSKTLAIYDSNSFYAQNSIESRKYAVISLLETLYKLERKLKISLKPYNFNVSREHYGQIKNDLAIQHNRKGEKLHIYDDGKEWLWIDDSESLGELETNNLINSKQVQYWWNDMKKHKFEVTPSFLMEQLKGLIQTQQMNADNIVKHQEVLDEMLITLKKIQEKL